MDSALKGLSKILNVKKINRLIELIEIFLIAQQDSKLLLRGILERF